MHTIGKAAKQAGLSVDTLRYYEREGLLPRPRRTASGYRLYDEAAIARLRFINRAKTLGFTLAQIRELLQLNDGGGERKSVRVIARARVEEIARKIEDLERMRAMLEHLVSECDGHGKLAGCPIIEALLEDDGHSASNGRAKPPN
jgi:MerR family copper efflux transcriptional regulator